MKKLIAVLIFVVLFAINGFAQTPCQVHTETVGRFSYCPPAGWVPMEPAADQKYKRWFTPENAAFKANLNVNEEATTISHNEYMAAALKLVMKDNPAKGAGGSKLIGWTEFSTPSKISGSRVVFETLYEGTLVRTTQYILDLPGKKLVFTFSALESAKAANDPLFDAAMKTLKTF